MRFQRKLFILYGAFLLGLVLIWLRVVQLQTLEGERWKEAARQVRQRPIKLQAPRGRIVDRLGNVLAEDERVFQLAFRGSAWLRRLRVRCTECGSTRFYADRKYEPKRCACQRHRQREGLEVAAAGSGSTFERLPMGDLAPLERALGMPLGTLAGRAAERIAQVKRLVEAGRAELLAKGLGPFRIDDRLRLRKDDLLQRPYVLETGIPESAVRLVQLDETGNYRGFRIQTTLRRRYPQPGYSPQMLGFTSKVRDEAEYDVLKASYPNQVGLNSAIGRAGLERAYHWQLAGRVGHRVTERDREGLFTREVSQTLPIGGDTVQLSVDLETSLRAQAALKQHAPPEGYGPGTQPSGGFVMMDAVTGRILVWAEMPTYDLNKDLGKLFDKHWNSAVVDKRQRRWVPLGVLPEGIGRKVWEQSLTNPAPRARSRVSGIAVEPGSTLKPLIALAALHAGRPLPFGSFRCGHLRKPGCHHHGNVGLERAIAESCNQYFAALIRFNPAAFTHYSRTVPIFLSALGIGREPGGEVAEWERGSWLRDWTDFSAPQALQDALAKIRAKHPEAKFELKLTRGRGFPRTLGGNRKLLASVFHDLLLQVWRESGTTQVGIHMSLLKDQGSELDVRFDVRAIDDGGWAHLPLQHSVATFAELPSTLRRAGRRVPAMAGKMRFEGSFARRGKVWFTGRFDARVGRTSSDDPRRIRRDDGWNIGIGQGPVLVTPLQMVRAMAAIANGGQLVSPQLAWTVGGSVKRTAAPLDLGWEPRFVERVRTGMRGVVEYGTAEGRGLERVPARVYGKTGTAQVGAAWRPFALPGEVSSMWHHWFVGFAERPGENPIAFACVLHSRTEAGASMTSAKAVADILQHWYTRGAVQDVKPLGGGR